MKCKSFAVYVLCCFLLCNSVLADFETIADGYGVDSNNDIGISDVPDSSVPDVSEGGLDEDFTVDETVDSVVDSVSDLVNSATSEPSPGESVSQVSPGGNTVYVLTQPDSEVVRDSTPTPVSIDDPGVTITDISLSSVAPVTPSSTSGLKAALLGILGNYDPVIVEYQYQSSQGYNNYLREVQPDYVWLCSAALLALVIYCLFKLGGGLIRG